MKFTGPCSQNFPTAAYIYAIVGNLVYITYAVRDKESFISYAIILTLARLSRLNAACLVRRKKKQVWNVRYITAQSLRGRGRECGDGVEGQMVKTKARFTIILLRLKSRRSGGEHF